MQRLLFANQLRGLAALSVVVSHLLAVFWNMRDYVSAITASPAQVGGPPGIIVAVSYPWFNFGPFGVALFFLISGLVIPFSLQRHSRGSFLVARALRIFPTYIVAVLIEVAVVYAGSAYWQQPFPFRFSTILANLFLVHEYFGQPSIDAVNWTLGVELKFYLIMSMVAGSVRQGRMSVLFGIAIAILAGNFYVQVGGPLPRYATLHPGAVLRFSTDSLCVLFMLIGVVCNFHVRGLMQSGWALLSAAILLALFLWCWWISRIADQFPLVTVNYLYACGLFGFAYLLRGWTRPVWVLDFFANISYPLYLVHALVGYSVLKVLMVAWNVPYEAALLLALAVVVLCAVALHHVVEQPSIDLGRKCTPKKQAIAIKREPGLDVAMRDVEHTRSGQVGRAIYANVDRERPRSSPVNY